MFLRNFHLKQFTGRRHSNYNTLGGTEKGFTLPTNTAKIISGNTINSRMTHALRRVHRRRTVFLETFSIGHSLFLNVNRALKNKSNIMMMRPILLPHRIGRHLINSVKATTGITRVSVSERQNQKQPPGFRNVRASEGVNTELTHCLNSRVGAISRARGGIIRISRRFSRMIVVTRLKDPGFVSMANNVLTLVSPPVRNLGAG